MQLLTSKTILFFDSIFRKKFGFEEYESLDKPTVFFGLYRKGDIAAAINHRGVKIIWFAGTDAMNEKTLRVVKSSPGLKDAIIIAESSWIEEDLAKMGIKYESISLCMDDIYNWSPVPLGDKLYWYGGNTTRYGKHLLAEVRRAIPDLGIIVNDSNTVERSKMSEIYGQCFAGVRTISHDGMSQTVSELGLMGRISIWNMRTPFSIPYHDQNDLIETIRRLRAEDYNYKLVAKRAKGFFIENETKWTDLILKTCGTGELDIARIFYKDNDRPVSFFRIMRRDVIAKLPDKFGGKQFERPYISNELNNLGLKQLITSKNSGFAVTEWKNTDKKKGYVDNNFNTHDRGTI